MRKQKTLYARVEEGLKGMNIWMELQVGFMFNYHKNRVGGELNDLTVQDMLEYEDWKTRYDNLVRRAKDQRLI